MHTHGTWTHRHTHLSTSTQEMDEDSSRAEKWFEHALAPAELGRDALGAHRAGPPLLEPNRTSHCHALEAGSKYPFQILQAGWFLPLSLLQISHCIILVCHLSRERNMGLEDWRENGSAHALCSEVRRAGEQVLQAWFCGACSLAVKTESA